MLTAAHANRSWLTAASQKIEIGSENSLGRGHLAVSRDAGSVQAFSKSRICCTYVLHMKCHGQSLPGTAAVKQGPFPDVTEISQVLLSPMM